MDDETINVWYQRICKPLIANYDGELGKLRNDLKLYEGIELLIAVFVPIR